MSSVWYVGRANTRVVDAGDWANAGVSDGASYFRWDTANGYSYPTTAFTRQQLAWLDAQNEQFWVGAPDGPRTVVIYAPESFITLNQLREFLSSYQFPEQSNLTKASVGLDRVDNTADVEKPLSTAASQALARKISYPLVDGTDGQTLVRDGALVKWVSPAQTGGNSGALAVTPIADSDAPSGTVYRITGSGVAQTPDPDAPSGYVYSIN